MERAPPVLNSSDVQLALRDCYETTYGIHNHASDSADQALALVALREVEDSASGGLLYERIRQHRDRQVLKYFGLNLIQFLELPTDLVTFVLELSLQSQQSDKRTQEDVASEIQHMAGGG
jgi:hypothetical protein